MINGYRPKALDKMKTFGEMFQDLKSRKKIIVDPGKNTVKILVLNENNEILYFYSFPSKLDNPMFLPADQPKEGQFFITIPNKIKTPSGRLKDAYYILGEQVNPGDGKVEFKADKNTFHHRLCVLAAVHLFVEDNEDVDLVVGYPSENYKNENLKNDYVNSILMGDEISNLEKSELIPPGTITLNVNGKVKTFHIKNVTPYQEGLGQLTIHHTRYMSLANEAQKKGKKTKESQSKFLDSDITTIFIDLGGYNANLHMRKGEVYSGHESVDKIGVNILEKKYLIPFFRRAIKNPAILEKIKDIDWHQVIGSGKIFGQTELDGLKVEELLEDAIMSFIERELIPEINQVYDKDIVEDEQIALVFLGGGSARIKPFLEYAFKDKLEKGLVSFSPAPLWDNVVTYAFLYYGGLAQKLHSVATENDGVQLEEAKKHFNLIRSSLVVNGGKQEFISQHAFKSQVKENFDFLSSIK